MMVDDDEHGFYFVLSCVCPPFFQTWILHVLYIRAVLDVTETCVEFGPSFCIYPYFPCILLES